MASLKLAVFVILAIIVVAAWGTFVESIHNDAKIAQERVYHSWYSYAVFFLLAVNLTAVMVDRWPWKRHHLGFLMAHMGILILMTGALITRYLGVDGSIVVGVGESKNRVTVGNTDLVVYSGLVTGGARKIYEKEVHFLRTPPSEKNPHTVTVGQDEIVIDGFRPYSLPQGHIQVSDKKRHGPGLQFQISNEKISESGWLLLGRSSFEVRDLGPARIVLARKGQYTDPGNGFILLLESLENSDFLNWSIFSAKKPVRKGVVKAGDSIETGWMGLRFRLLQFLKSARQTWSYEPLLSATEESIQSLRFHFRGKKYWMGINSSVRLFSDEAYHVLVYANRQLELDFSLRLDEFRVGRYEGTQRASSYESDVSVIHEGFAEQKATISMNEPLKYRGFTFYQSSFKEDEKGRPVLSVFSVNRDPGRFWKYLGSFLMVFGIVHLFYLKRKSFFP